MRCSANARRGVEKTTDCDERTTDSATNWRPRGAPAFGKRRRFRRIGPLRTLAVPGAPRDGRTDGARTVGFPRTLMTPVTRRSRVAVRPVPAR